jgi:Flp pilus assembly pilin Flp
MRVAYKRFLADERGAAMLEYGLIAAGIALVTLAGVHALGAQLDNLRQTIVTGLQSLNGAH